MKESIIFMINAIVYPSSILFYLNYNANMDIDQFSLENRILTDLPVNFESDYPKDYAEKLSNHLGIRTPISVMMPSAKDRIHNKNIISCIRPKVLPSGSFIEIQIQRIPTRNALMQKSPNQSYNDISGCSRLHNTNFNIGHLADLQSGRILMASPEMSFLQAASHLDIQQLILLGNELCGMYVYDSSSEYGQRSRKPITSADSILKFAEVAQGFPNYKLAMKAARYISNSANSHMESILAALISMPPSLGGYSLLEPSLNLPLNIKNTLGHSKSIYSDFVWEDLKKIVEYDSSLVHSGDEKLIHDTMRRRVIEDSGYEVMVVVSSDFKNMALIDNVFARMRKFLGLSSKNAELRKYAERRRSFISYTHKFRPHLHETFY